VECNLVESLFYTLKLCKVQVKFSRVNLRNGFVF
jgi:hypothetical protein